ncbi:MAG: hypothetical protein IIY06_06810 [Proteobacteria bacterium]|nr:hypothetical protein [Pseudomonadota bacterium]
MMNEWFATLSGFEQGSFIIAVFGSVFFVAKLALQTLGIGGDVDGDADGSDAGDVDVSENVPAVIEGLHLFSVHGVALGLAIGGWSAMFFYASFASGFIGSLGGLVLGFVAMYIHAKFMKSVLKLQEIPTVNLKDAVGQVADVYLTIPKYGEGCGKINLVLNEALKDYDAMSRDDMPIPTGTKVRVMEVNEDGVMIVQRVTEEDV